MIKYDTLKPFIFKLDPELAHTIVEKVIHFGSDYLPFVNSYFVDKNFIDDEILIQEIWGRKFYNPIGLGAGFDKNATMITAMMGLGFGFSEIGTVTPKPQKGNQKPRLFRHIQEESLQNAMGFNNNGAFAIYKRLQQITPFATPIGINIGKNKLTPQNNALQDYRFLIKTFEDVADYLVVNISSPNTPNLRDLQNEAFIKELFQMSKEYTKKPILLKIAPDMSHDIAISICKSAVDNGASGIIATNTTIDYSLVNNPRNFGGISGKVLNQKSKEMFKEISKELFGKTTLVSVGGIGDANDVYERIKLGASLVQIFSMLIYKGPTLIKEINKDLIKLLQADGFKHISQAIGCKI